MARVFAFAPDEYYHVYNRGVDKRDIFVVDEDKTRFQKLLYLCNGDKELDMRAIPYDTSAYDVERGTSLTHIGAYAMMDNHFHLLLREFKDGGISTFMHKLGISHTKYFNLRNERSGSLFEGVFKAVHVEGDRHLQRLFSYIHLNPTALLSGVNGPMHKKSEHIIKELRDFPFSSYQDHFGIKRLESKILSLKNFPKYFSSVSEYESDMTDWLTMDE